MTAIAHVLPTIAREAGGPSVSVRRLVETLAELRPAVDWMVFAGDAPAGQRALADWKGVSPRLFPESGPRRIGFAPQLRTALANALPAAVHVHGLWRYHTWASYVTASRARVPLIVSPRGMLEPWARRRSRLQKWIAGRLFQSALLRSASCVVATSDMEAQGVRAAGVTAPIAIVPNGIDAPPENGRAFFNGSSEPRVALFLSRIHPKKGVLDLVEAWRRIRPAGWRLRIVGPSEAGHEDEVRTAIARARLAGHVELSGPVWGEARHRAMAEAELFVLPSYSENFGLAIGEALAAGLPVVTTRATPWQEIETVRCGWWIEPGEDSLASAMRAALNCSRTELQQMGKRGAALVADRYSWTSVAMKMLEVYCRAMGVAGLP